MENVRKVKKISFCLHQFFFCLCCLVLHLESILILYIFQSITVEDNAISWAGSDRDYTYDELLNRVFDIILEKNPDMAAGRKPKFVMRPPQVLRVGTKKTSFANFTEICKTLHR
jgi:Domain found in IF2B/IF5